MTDDRAKDLAEALVRAATCFAGTVAAEDPEARRIMASVAGALSVRVLDFMSAEPRVVLEAMVGDQVVEIGTMQLHRVGSAAVN